MNFRGWFRQIAFMAVLLAGVWAAAGPARAAGAAQQEVTRTFEKTLTLSSGHRLSVDHRMGDITIHTHPDRSLHVAASIHVSAPSRDEAQKFADQITIRLETSGTGVSVRTEYPDESRSWFRLRRNISYAVAYTIDMPEDAPLEIQNRFGNVSVTGLKAPADIHNAHGLLKFQDGRGNQILENSFGGIELTNNAGNAELTNSNSYVTASKVQGTCRIASATSLPQKSAARPPSPTVTVRSSSSMPAGLPPCRALLGPSPRAAFAET